MIKDVKLNISASGSAYSNINHGPPLESHPSQFTAFNGAPSTLNWPPSFKKITAPGFGYLRPDHEHIVCHMTVRIPDGMRASYYNTGAPISGQIEYTDGVVVCFEDATINRAELYPSGEGRLAETRGMTRLI